MHNAPNMSPTAAPNLCYTTPTDHPTGLAEFDNAYSEADCDKILRDKLKRIEDNLDEAEESEAIVLKRCDKKYELRMKSNELAKQAAYQTALANYQRPILELHGFWRCGNGGRRKDWLYQRRQSFSYHCSCGIGVAGAFVSLSTYDYYRNLANSIAQSLRDTADKFKENADTIGVKEGALGASVDTTKRE